MTHSEASRLKSLSFLHSLGFASLLHISLNILFSFGAAVYAPAFGVLIYLLLLLLKKSLSEEILISLLYYSMNIYILIVNVESPSAVTLIFFALPLISAAFSNDMRHLLVLLTATIIEVIVLAFYFGHFNKVSTQQYDQLSVLLFLAMIALLTFSHTFMFSRLWLQVKEKNKFMEEALISRGGYLQLFFETAKDAMAVFDTDNRVIAINPAFEKLYGWTAEEAYGKEIKPYPDEKEEMAVFRSAQLNSGKSFTMNDTVDMKKDGTTFHAHITLSPIFGSQQNIIATSLISRDITYQKESEKLILQSEKLKLAGEIAAGVAHEIRNPMTVISGFIQIMQEDPDHPYPQYTELIQSELERINQIISEFLVLAKPQALLTKKFSLRKLIAHLTLLFSSEFNLKGIVFDEQWNSEKDYLLSGEENLIKQVFINLFKNAVDAVEKNGAILLSVSLSDNNLAVIKIADTGTGIPAENLKRIYEPFYTTKEHGTGLGLLISQKIIQDHGGALHISSEPGKGTVVEVQLPVN